MSPAATDAAHHAVAVASGGGDVPPGAAPLPPEVAGLRPEEAVRRLRSLGQPATLFGEDARDRLLRLAVAQRALAAAPAPEEGRVTGQQQDELGRALRAMAKQQQAGAGGAAPASAAGASVAAGGDASAAPAAAPTEEEALGATFAAAARALAAARAEAVLCNADKVALHFKRLVDAWLEEVEARAAAAPEWAATAEGRTGLATARLTKEHLRPLLKALRRRECPVDIERRVAHRQIRYDKQPRADSFDSPLSFCRALWLMVKAMNARNYKEAGDLYVRVAIGNAAWPIGVTMVGIHERSAREKISASSTAHVMHDEQTRKYLQAVKRLITFAQRKYPSTPSLSLEFDSGINGSDKQSLLAAEAAEAAGTAKKAVLMIEAPGSRPAHAGGALQDGWRANDDDIRTWKSIMRRAAADEKPGMQ